MPPRVRCARSAGNARPVQSPVQSSKTQRTSPRSRRTRPRERNVTPLLCAAADSWQRSRVDVRESTLIHHRTALGRVLPILGDRAGDGLTAADVADLVVQLSEAGKARASIRKSVGALAMVLDHAGVTPNPARDRVRVRLPLEEPTEPEPPTADTIEAAAPMLTRRARCGPGRRPRRDATRMARPRSRVETRRPRWVVLPDDLYAAVIGRLPAARTGTWPHPCSSG